MLDTALQDLRYGVRILARTPGFTAIVVFILALGIGANTAIFSVVNGVLLRPLPYPSPHQLLMVWGAFPGSGQNKLGLSQMEFVRLRSESKTLKQVAFYRNGIVTLTGRGEAERISTAYVSANLFATLGADVLRGRSFTAEEEEQGHNNVVVLSHGFWQRRFAADTGAIGQSLTLNGTSFTVIGVLPPDFQSPAELLSGARRDLWLTPGLNMAQLNVGSHGLNTIARLSAGTTMARAQAEVSAIIGRIVKEHPSFYPVDGSYHNFLTHLHEEVVGNVRLALLVLLGAVAFVLLIACANVANLMLARGEGRHKEMAIRAALGASRWRVVQQLLVESLLLALIGAIVGVLMSSWGLAALATLSPGNIPRLSSVKLDAAVLGFTLLVSLLTGVFCDWKAAGNAAF